MYPFIKSIGLSNGQKCIEIISERNDFNLDQCALCNCIKNLIKILDLIVNKTEKVQSKTARQVFNWESTVVEILKSIRKSCLGLRPYFSDSLYTPLVPRTSEQKIADFRPGEKLYFEYFII